MEKELLAMESSVYEDFQEKISLKLTTVSISVDGSDAEHLMSYWPSGLEARHVTPGSLVRLIFTFQDTSGHTRTLQDTSDHEF